MFCYEENEQTMKTQLLTFDEWNELHLHKCSVEQPILHIILPKFLHRLKN